MPDADAPFNADSTLVYLESRPRRLFNKTVALAGLGTYFAYLVYRTLYTINTDAIVFSVLVYFAEVHGFFSLVFYFHQVWDLRKRVPPPPQDGVTIDVFITTYNEDVDLLRQTARAAVAMDYPHETYILDDGRRPEVKALAEEVGCRYITRATNEHAKAGNWNNAFRQTTGALIATFDADHVPRADFLLRTIGFFRDPKVALVQVPQRYHNVDSLQHRINWKIRRMYGEQDVFFNLVCAGKDHWNSVFFCGTGAVLRRQALAPRGGLETGSITEDMHTSIVLHAEGWKSVYLDELLVTGLAPMDFAGFQAQRLRWAEGNLKIIFDINPLTVPGLSIAQRICYFASMYHWTIGVPKIIFYLAPPWILFTGAYPIANFDRTFLGLYTIFLGSLIVSCKILGRGHGRLVMDEIFNMATAFTLNRALKRLLFGRGKPATFVVTDKRGGQAHGVKEVLPHYVLVAFSLLSLEWIALSLSFGVVDDTFGSGVSAFWVCYNLVLMGAVIEMALRPVQKRQTCRFSAALPISIAGAGPGGAPEVGMTRNVSAGGCELLWPNSLPVGSVHPITIAFGRQTLQCEGEVTAVFGRKGAWFAHGMRFVNLSQAQVDFLNDAFFSLVVPGLFDHLSQPGPLTRAWRLLTKRFTAMYHARARRTLVSLPVRLEAGADSQVAMVHDLSNTGFGVIVSQPIALGTDLTMTVLGELQWNVQVRVARCQPLPAVRPAFQTWLVGLHVVAATEARTARRKVMQKAAA